MQGMMAPGHVYDPSTKTGILLEYGGTSADGTEVKISEATIWQVGQVIASTRTSHELEQKVRTGGVGVAVSASISAPLPPPKIAATSEWEFWYSLEFARVFPQVTHWWFGSAWTQRVRLGAPYATMDGDKTVTGLMQFVDDEQAGLPWTMTRSDQVLIHTPLPPFEVSPANLPLRLVLAELVIALVQGDIRADEWQLVTSLVERNRLAALLPALSSGVNWRLDDPRFRPELSLRQLFCTLQGLATPTTLAPTLSQAN